MKPRSRAQARLARDLKFGGPCPDEFSFSKRLRGFKFLCKKFNRREGRRLDKKACTEVEES